MIRHERTCQECGWVQNTRPPPSRSSDAYWAWAEIPCQRCKSPALDYGNPVDLSEKTG